MQIHSIFGTIMKRLLISLFCILMCLSAAARNRALLIGIGEYPESSGWEKISAANDMRLLSSTLKGYDITVLQDEKATYAGIKNAFAQFTAKCTPGDTVIVHFSCHGQQMICIDKSNEELDLLDEAIVPYDAKAKYSIHYKGEHHLRDNELAILIDFLRKKVGSYGFVLVSIDACHSNTLDRSENAIQTTAILRGTGDIFGKNVDAQIYLRHKYKTSKDLIPKLEGMSDVVFVSACKEYEKNKEILVDGTGYGSLTYALVNNMLHITTFNITKFIEGIKETMYSLKLGQNPGFRASFDIYY